MRRRSQLRRPRDRHRYRPRNACRDVTFVFELTIAVASVRPSIFRNARSGIDVMMFCRNALWCETCRPVPLDNFRNMPQGVSFVIPVYNGEEWLERMLSAVLAQADGRPMEII